jgi:hypothetical protein
MYDIIFLGEDDVKWDKFKKEYPASHRVCKITAWTDLKKISFTNHFWIIWDNIEFISGYNLNDYRVSKWEEQYTHIFRNGKYYDGVALVSKKHFPSNREFNHRFFVHKKEIDVTLSNPKPFDIIFISYQEPTADENYQTLLERFPRAKRIHGVKGIHNAHIEAAKLSTTDMFWVVDADAIVEPTFNFEVDQFPEHDTYTKSIVRVWRSRNPINGLRYGYGGIKLLPKNLTINMDLSKPDMTTSISPSFTAMPEVSNITCINTDPFTAWKSAFRECVKLSSKTITGQVDRETEYRLSVWCSTGADKQYGEYAIKGAIAGKEFGTINKDNIDQLKLINDFDWLLTQFQSSFL